ncbi:XTP/dITP diphosphatase [Cytobacillus sp. FJAT-54145]|uniref:dITP/XTP pyrophosphatase n=1 Tax=Cytobacillus spartinae TaxID=3299023 RepID=A0ABW6KHR8_9BACI
MKEVVIATKNSGKAKEFERMLRPRGFEVKTLLDFDDIEDVEETGKTFEENAILKAEAISKLFGKIVIADDSGLVVDALDGRPGIYSARYAGEAKNDEANIDKVLEELVGVNEEARTARFCCALAVAVPSHETKTVFGTCEGVILQERRGQYGFGYDPIFYVTEKRKTMAELTPEEKNQISHRSLALRKLEEVLPDLLG